MSRGIKAFAPASVANMAVGYDVLGYAIEGPGDEVIAKFNHKNKGVVISKISGDNKLLPKDPTKNTAGVAAMKLLAFLGEDAGIDLEIRKKMPFGSGLGSSAASAVAAVVAINDLTKARLSKKELLEFAVLGEQAADGAYHADNVAPSLLGGITLIRNNSALDVISLPIPKGLISLVIYPEIEILTKTARSILSDQILLTDHITQSGNLGGVISALFLSDFNLLKRSIKDVIIEPQRARLIEGFYDIKEIFISNGSLGCSISGAGPSIFGLFNNSMNADKVAQLTRSYYSNKGINCSIFNSKINSEGAYIF